MKFLASSFTALAILSLVASASAVGTRRFRLDALSDFKGGELSGASVDSQGVVRAGLRFGTVPLPGVTSAWSALDLQDGTALVGTGADGKVLRVTRNGADEFAKTGEMAVTALVQGREGEVFAATIPNGKIFKLATKGKQAPVLFSTLEGAGHVWSLAYDAKTASVYAGTGPDGKVFRIDAQGKAHLLYDAEDAHVLSVHVAPDGAILAGTEGKALLLRISGPGRATVLHDFAENDVRAIATTGSGQAFRGYAIVNTYPDFTAGNKKASPSANDNQAQKPPKPGKGKLYAWGPDGLVEELYASDDTHFVSLAADAMGALVGTGAGGEVYRVTPDHVAQLVADTDERTVAAVLPSTRGGWLLANDPAVAHPIEEAIGSAMRWVSPTLDAGMLARYGQLSWKSTGKIEVATRTGTTLVPDATWSDWLALDNPGAITSPPGRFLQIRATWAGDPKATLSEVEATFVTENARPVVTGIDVGSRGGRRKGGDIEASGAEPPRSQPKVKLSWQVSNPDADELRYRVSYSALTSARWYDVIPPGEILSKTEFTWDTGAMPEGEYRIRVEASDELANPIGAEKKHSLESGVFAIDNTPPRVEALALRGRKLTGQVSDGLGPIERIEVSRVGAGEWRSVRCSDGICDENTESLDADLSGLVPPGTWLVAIRVYDRAGNTLVQNIQAE